MPNTSPAKPKSSPNIDPPGAELPRVGARDRKRPNAIDGEYGLTLMEARFVEAYVGPACRSAAKAAKMAGSKATSMASLAVVRHRILRGEAVQSFLKEAITRSILGAQEVLERLSAIVSVNMDDYFVKDEDTGGYRFDLEHARLNGDMSLIQSMTIEDGVVTGIKFPPKNEALGLMSKYHGLLIDKIQVVEPPDVRAIQRELIMKLDRAIESSQRREPIDVTPRSEDGD